MEPPAISPLSSFSQRSNRIAQTLPMKKQWIMTYFMAIFMGKGSSAAGVELDNYIVRVVCVWCCTVGVDCM